MAVNQGIAAYSFCQNFDKILKVYRMFQMLKALEELSRCLDMFEHIRITLMQRKPFFVSEAEFWQNNRFLADIFNKTNLQLGCYYVAELYRNLAFKTTFIENGPF